jgi:hypothetical protein
MQTSPKKMNPVALVANFYNHLKLLCCLTIETDLLGLYRYHQADILVSYLPVIIQMTFTKVNEVQGQYCWTIHIADR